MRTLVASFVLIAAVGNTAEKTLHPFFVPRAEIYDEDVSEPNLIVQIGLDFKNVFTTKDNAYIMAAGLTGAVLVSPFDESLAESGFNSELSDEAGRLDGVFETGEIAGAGHVQLAAAFATYGLGKVFRNDEISGLGRDLVRAHIVTASITYAVKRAVGRERPDASSTTSFPSGHTSASFATASVLQRRYGWDVGVPAYAFAAYVGSSRLNEGKHFLSDVVVGAAIGIMVGRTVTLDLANERFALAPMIVRGGGGVSLTWVGGAR